jgi:hypothetical protein
MSFIVGVLLYYSRRCWRQEDRTICLTPCLCVLCAMILLPCSWRVVCGLCKGNHIRAYQPKIVRLRTESSHLSNGNRISQFCPICIFCTLYPLPGPASANICLNWKIEFKLAISCKVIGQYLCFSSDTVSSSVYRLPWELLRGTGNISSIVYGDAILWLGPSLFWVAYLLDIHLFH